VSRLVAESLLSLLRTEWYLLRHHNVPLYEFLKRHMVFGPTPAPHDTAEIIRSMDIACVFYFKPVKCLQRSVAVAMVLRKYGYQAEVVIGAKTLPFSSHAWVEFEGIVLNDKPYISKIYSELERC
jgi:prolyl oligopeptidase